MKVQYIGIFLITVSMLLIITTLFSKKDTFFDLRNIFTKHLALFKDSKRQYLTFYIYPLLLAVGISIFYVADTDFYEGINVILSIFVSMLLAIFSILVSKDYSDLEETKKSKIKKVLEETNNAIIFTICLCIFLMIVGLIMIAIKSLCAIVSMTIATVTYYLFLIILLNILLIIKRLGKLVQVK